MPLRLILLAPALLALFWLTSSCASTRAPYRVLPQEPGYVLRSPDLKDTPFPQIPARYAASGQGWVDLRPHMGIRVENAYFHEGAAKHTVDEFIGTEVAEYAVDARGRMRLESVQPKVPQQPQDQPPVQALLADSLARYRFHRHFYQVVFNRSNGQVSGAVLLGAKSASELAALSARIFTDPDSVCNNQPGRCTVFPELCSVSVQMDIAVNGMPRRVLWASTLGSVAIRPQSVQLLRDYAGRPTPVEVDLHDPNAMRLSLLPGDRIIWQPLPRPSR